MTWAGGFATLLSVIKQKLNQLAQIFSGYSFRQAILDEEKGIRVIHINNLDGLYVGFKNLKKTTLKIPQSQMLQPDDIILSSRGYFRAAVFQSKSPAVAAVSMFVIRLRGNQVSPEYVAIYLNSDRVQNYLKQMAKGSVMSSIRLKDLSEIEIPAIPMDQQKRLADLMVNLEKIDNLLANKRAIIHNVNYAAVEKQLWGAVK